MKWIDTNDLVRWADERNCQETMPSLIERLIRYTRTDIININFPSGNDIALPGFDGMLEIDSSLNVEFISGGKSVWEIGVGKAVKSKAEEDYRKRKINPIVDNPSQFTYVFVTPRKWTKAERWAEEKRKENFWKNVVVITGQELNKWLENAPPVSLWLSSGYLNKFPDGGVQSAEYFWEAWRLSPDSKIKLDLTLITAGRKKQSEQLLKLTKSPKIVSVRASTLDESIAFIICSFLSESKNYLEFISRSVIVENVNSLRQLVQVDRPLIIIAKEHDDKILNLGIAKGHTILVPLGRDASESWIDSIVLPNPDRDEFISALVTSGVNKRRSEKLSKGHL
ncbi:MAG TPA: hypothetical protein PKZ91_09980 [Saprospiraceae bacterium]|nr:hypothetical protein [Saprospiraceae bacterium]